MIQKHINNTPRHIKYCVNFLKFVGILKNIVQNVNNMSINHINRYTDFLMFGLMILNIMIVELTTHANNPAKTSAFAA